MRDPEVNLSHKLRSLKEKLKYETDETVKRQFRDEMRQLERRTEEIQRMKAYGIKFRKS